MVVVKHPYIFLYAYRHAYSIKTLSLPPKNEHIAAIYRAMRLKSLIMKKLCLFILLITIVGIFPSLVQNGCFVLSTDMASQEVPFIIETKRMLTSGCPLWSWNHLIGDNFIASYTFYTLTSPFVWINCLFPDQWMLYGITFTLLLKMLCTGLVAYVYLRKMSISTDASIVGALMYAFSSFAVSNLFYYHFLEPMIAFPLLLTAIERFIRRERYGGVCMVLASFLVFFINYYFAACSMVAALIYALCRLGSKEIHASAARVGYGVLLVGVGLLLSCFVLLPTVAHFQGNPRQSFQLSKTYLDIIGCIERLYTLFEPKLVEGPNTAFFVYSFGSNAANIPVIGLLLAGLYALRRSSWIGSLIIVSIVLYVTPLNDVFSFFTNPGYTRWAYAFTLFVILASMKFVDEKQRLTMRHFWVYAAICCAGVTASYVIGLYCNQRFYGSAFDRSDLMINLIAQALFLFQMVLLFLYVRHNNTAMLLRCVVVMSLVYFPVSVLMNTDFMNKSQYRTEMYGSIKQYMLDNSLPYHNGNFEWRTDFLAQFPNVSMLKNRPSASTFNSVQNNTMAPLLNAIGSRMGVNTAKAEKSAVSFDALMSVKEIIEYDNYRHLCDSLKRPEASREACLSNRRAGDGYTIYDNKYYIPMGFTYDSYISQSRIDSLMAADCQADIPLQLLANLVVPDTLVSVANSVLAPGEIRNDLSIDSLVTARRKNVCTTFSGDTRGFKATVNMPEKNMLFFSVLSDKGFKGYVDGVETTIYPVNLSLSAVMVDKGYHQVEFKYFPRGLHEGLLLTLAGLVLTLIVLIIDMRSQRGHCRNRKSEVTLQQKS